MISKDLTTNVVNKHRQHKSNATAANIKNKIKQIKLQNHPDERNKLQNNLNDNQRPLLELNQEQRASSWLITLSTLDESYDLTKQLFLDLIWITIRRLPTNCECRTRFDLQHALSCKKGGFMSISHKQLRNIPARLLKEVCKDIRVVPQLQQLTGETLRSSTIT